MLPLARVRYLLAVEDFLVCLDARGVGALAEIRPLHVAAHVEALSRSHAPATVKERLAEILSAARLDDGWVGDPVERSSNS